MGQALVNDGPPQKADVIVVLGGDWRGHRILTAARLAREGYAPTVFVGGAANFFGHHESELATTFAVEHGYPREAFVAYSYPALATLDEVAHDADELRKRGVHKLLVVTNPWHTARAMRIFHSVAPDLEAHAVACDDRNWNNGHWWETREGRKQWAFEAIKTTGEFLGL